MRLLWAYEHDFVAISPFLYERIGTLCRHPCWSLYEQRIAGWRSGRSEGYCKSLAQRLEAWLTLPSLSRWLTCTIRLGYAFQFARRTPKFNGVLETSVAVRKAPVLREEIAVLLAKDAIEPVPPAERRQGFYSPYFIVPKKRGGLRPILDLRVLNRALHKLPFRVGDLQAFSVSEECLVFGPVYSHVVLRPRPGYVPKVPTTPFRDQVVNLQALPSEEADPALALLMDRTRSVRSSEQLFVCHGGQQKGKAVSKQRLAHWIVEAVTLTYESQGEPCPLAVRAHSTRSVASSHALAHGASLADICRAAGWATPNTLARFYNLCIEPVSSRVLSK